MTYLKSTLILASILSISSAYASTAEEFFKGFENGCQGPAEFNNYVQNICKYQPNKKTLEECTLGKIQLPKNMEVLSTQVKNKGDHSWISVKFKSDTVTWRGLPVIGIDTWHGHSNGIHGQALVVKASSTKIAKDTAIKNGAKFIELENDVLGPIGAVFQVKNSNTVHIVCDQSD